MQFLSHQIILLLSLTSLLLFSCKQPLSNHVNAVATIIEDYHNEGKFNGSVLVIHKDIKLINKSYGYANATKQDTLTRDHQFGIGSIYKEFPGVVLMQLVEAGKVMLGDKISAHVAGLPEWSNKVTMLHLLQYTSGLPRIDFNKYFGQNLPIRERDLFKDLLELPQLEFEPGSDYIYSNFNPYLIIKAIENIEQKPFAKVVQSSIFHPLGMQGEKFKVQYPYKADELMAKPMNADFEEDRYAIEYSSLLLTLTPRDLAIWVKELNDLNLINQESLLTIAQPASLDLDDMQAPLGNTEIENGRIVTHLHHGSMGNYESLVKRNNVEDWTIVLMTNQKHKNVFEILEKIELTLQE